MNDTILKKGYRIEKREQMLKKIRNIQSLSPYPDPLTLD